MSISAMKQALVALDSDNPDIQLRAAISLRQAIEQAEKQEPAFECPRCGHCCKEWVGLTDEDIEEIDTEPYWDSVIIDKEGIGDLARQIEAKLKEKNT
jgi:hypothetical protein